MSSSGVQLSPTVVRAAISEHLPEVVTEDIVFRNDDGHVPDTDLPARLQADAVVVRDGGGKVPEADLPARLSQESLTATSVSVDGGLPKIAPAPGSPLGAVPGMVRGAPGRSYAFVAGVIRNYNDGLGWRLIDDGFHPTVGITDVDSLTDTGLIRVDYPGLKIDGGNAGRTVTLVAVPDETLAKAGFTCGVSVEADKARIQLAQTRSLNDFLYYDTAAGAYKLWKNEFWGAGRSPFTVDSVTGNHVILTHAQAIVEDRFDFGVDAVGIPGENYTPRVSTNTAATILTQVNIDFCADVLTGSKGHDWPSINDSGTSATGVTVTGCAVGDFAVASMDQALPDGMVLSAAVTAADTVRVTLFNRTGSTQDIPSGTLRVFTRKGAGGAYRITTPDTKCRAYVRRGMARSYVAPADVHEGTYPSGNIWIFGFMQDQNLA